MKGVIVMGMNEEMVMSDTECRQKNHQIGLKYAELSNRMDELAQKLKRYSDNGTVDDKWDFENLQSIYTDIAMRMSAISDKLCSC